MTVATSTVTHQPSHASTIGFQLGNHTYEILDTLGVDDMRLLVNRARTAILPDLLLAVQPAIFPNVCTC